MEKNDEKASVTQAYLRDGVWGWSGYALEAMGSEGEASIR